MERNSEKTKKTRAGARLASAAAAVLLAFALIVTAIPAGSAYAASSTSDDPIREMHKVGVGKKAYCFFVTHNVVLTPADIAKYTDDDELTEEILKRSGLYMKEANCKLSAHKAIEPKAWAKKGGSISLIDGDAKEESAEESSEESGEEEATKTDIITEIREAAATVTDGSPARFSLDLGIKTDADDEEATVYTTHKANSPDLMFIAVATEADAKSYGEEICEEEKTKTTTKTKTKTKTSSTKTTGSGEDDEMLPEYRTISMTDRSGDPVEPTLKDGDPVTLEWREPGKKTDLDIENEDSRPFWLIPAAAALLVAALIAFFVIRRKKRAEESE